MVKLYDCLEKSDSKSVFVTLNKTDLSLDGESHHKTSFPEKKEICPQSWYVRCHWPASKGFEEPCKVV